jgi:hypothetical protein
MRDTLPNKVNNNEVGIVNLDSVKNKGTHWVCYSLRKRSQSDHHRMSDTKIKDKCYYFDSFGLDPPIELQKYLNSDIELSTFQIQKFNTHHCGYYCILVLKLLEKYNYKDIILSLN